MKRLLWALWALLMAVLVFGGCSTGGELARGGPPPGPPGGADRSPAPALAADPSQAARFTLPPSTLTEEQRILHVLNRLGYGPRPGDLERVRQRGLAAHIQEQLEPGRLADEAVERRLAGFPTLRMSPAELLREYPQPDPKLLQKAKEGGMTRRELLEAFPPERRPYRISAEMQAAKLLRAAWSERQLEEVMVDFWFNHFNVFAQKGAVRWMLPSYEREAIRPHALGRFRDLVRATARHPAMLFYLDNWISVRDDFTVPFGPNAGRKAGLNENYARELMELHTLGVDGGYTQQDVIEVARCFTGWSIDRPQAEGRFVFRPLTHDRGDKRVLGHVIPAGGGESDGLRVIDILVRHPSTARFIATKLARRFVSDEPPPALVERAARTFLQTDGDIRAVLVTIVTSPEFFSPEAYRAKIKKPLEVVASAMRALGAEPGQGGGLMDGGFALARAVAQLGEPLYEAQPPTGHPDTAEAWVNTGALLARMNFALALAHNRMPGARVDLDRLLADADRQSPPQVLDRLLAVLLSGQATPETRAVLERQLGDPEIRRATGDDRGPANTDVEKVAALVLGAPEFQRR